MKTKELHDKLAYLFNYLDHQCDEEGAKMVEDIITELRKTTIFPNVQQNLFNYFDQEHGIQLMVSDFNEIQEYMKPEVKSVAIEFGKFISPIKEQIWLWDEDEKLWRTFKDGETIKLTESELFAKFEAERGDK